jgi:NAD(P)-dependent dehydrogenase (short-subunit alcohol dehydrogenase family)
MSITDERPTTATSRRAEARRVIVTGGASGLGAAVADLLASKGDRVVILDRKDPAEDRHGQPRTGSHRHAVSHHAVDLSDTRWAEQTVELAIHELGGCDALVACAGIDACGRFDEVASAAWEQVVAVNLLGTAAVVRAALPALKEAQGHVVTVASTLGLRALPAATAYCASKFGVVGFSRALAAETQGRPSVTCLIPGGMATSFFDGRPEEFKPAPDAVLNRPRDVAAVVEFVLSQPTGCEIRELIVCPETEASWP